MQKTCFAIVFLVAASAHAATLPSWMSGSWGGNVDGVQMEEHWTTAAGGVMLSMHRDVRANGKVSFEFARIEERGDSLVFLAMPGGRPPTPFPMTSQTADSITFENPEHDFPQRILYWRDGPRLCARVEGPMNGTDVNEQWCWEAMK